MTLHRRLLNLSLVACAIGFTSVAHAAPPAGDPCDFTSAFSFDRDQVLACYRSVPFCPDPGNPATCDRDAQVKHLRAAIEGFSDLREIYDPTAHWRRKLDAVEKAKFKSDYDFFLAMADVQASFRNAHWHYVGPPCFEETLFAMLPIGFGSMVTKVRGGEQQILYLSEPNFLSFLYFIATGIDVAPYTGQRIVLINGEPPLQFFRRWARDGLHQDSDDGINLMEVIHDLGYTLRTGSFNAFPESPSVELLLETRAGVRTKLELPWSFVPFTHFGFPGPPPASSAEFQALCFQPRQSFAASRRAPAPNRAREPVAFDERLEQRRAWLAALAATQPSPPSTPVPADFSEVPPEKLNQDITEVLPFSDGARTVAYTSDTVAVQLRSDFRQDWDDEFAEGASYACEHADRLIVDLRGNRGGFISRAQRFAHYLNPGQPAVPSAVFSFRELARSPAINELRRLSEPLVSLGFDPCTSGYEPACYVRVPSGEIESDPRWYTHETLERRGVVLEPLTPLATYAGIVPDPDRIIPCPGKFTGRKLVLLLNGVNGSAAFFGPELLSGVGTLVVEGGFVNEPMLAGRNRGGPVTETSSFQETADFLRDVTGAEAVFRLPELPRPTVFTVEYDAVYKANLRQLYVDHPPFGDLQVPFWSNSPETDGAAYRAAVSGVERRAWIDEPCGLLAKVHACGLYDRCAQRALESAVHDGELSAETAARTLEDAGAACL